MPALFVFLLKVNIALLLFCAGYYLVLRPLTFYTLNRVYLLAAIVFASVYPWLNLSAFLQRHEELVKPVQKVIINWQAPVLVKSMSQPDYWRWAEVIFWLGAYILALKLVVQLFSLYRLYKSSKPATINNHQVRIMDKDAAPFSFWQSIFVNPSKHEPADLKAILLHEQIHVNEWHTADILLAEVSSIFYWFNPGIWLMKKAIRENVEFITDRKILNHGIDSKTYQYSLVSVSFNNQQPGIVNHFNISTIKKRIIMMNAKRSSKINLTRYAFLVPAVITLLLVFSISKADFAKPIRVKLVNAVKPLENIITVAALPNPAGNTPLPKLKKVSRQTAKVLPVVKPDTIKKVLIIGDKNNKDSVVCYINGVKGSLKNIDPDNIAEVNVLKGDHVDRLPTYVNRDDVRNAGVILVITKDSPEGKARLQKSAKTDDIVLNGYKVNPDTKVDAIVVTGFKVQPDPKVTTTFSTKTSTNVNGAHTAVSADDSIAPLKKSLTTLRSISKTSTNGQSSTTGISVSSNKGIHITADNGSNPLIMVDGTETTGAALKNINPDRVEKVDVITGDDATKKYGNKAKDGVIIITTKKKVD
ncbi:M56 family metallopeptidase [Mucilaginibacter sp. RCC_168]|uniref:M56 family metallopeptidase n=1 Tax=Mucilaginibacter sp. RCC_168 TaxID=3239221 RepID=UPI00352437DF